MVGGGFNGDAAAGHFQELERLEQVRRSSGVQLGRETMQQFGQDQISDREHSFPEEIVQQIGLRRGHTVEGVDPDRGVDHDDLSSPSVATHCVQIARPLQLAAHAADPLLALQSNQQAQAVLHCLAPGPGAGEPHGFRDQLIIDDDVGAHCLRAATVYMKDHKYTHSAAPLETKPGPALTCFPR